VATRESPEIARTSTERAVVNLYPRLGLRILDTGFCQ